MLRRLAQVHNENISTAMLLLFHLAQVLINVNSFFFELGLFILLTNRILQSKIGLNIYVSTSMVRHKLYLCYIVKITFLNFTMSLDLNLYIYVNERPHYKNYF